MTITFFGYGPDTTREVEYQSPYFRTVEFKFDIVQTAPHVTSIDTWAIPNNPANLRHERLNIAQVYDRAGIEVQQSPNTNVVELKAGIVTEIWDDQQLHDAM
jgi:hypothetical protein